MNLREPKDGIFGKRLVPFWEIFIAWERWETHERFSLIEQLK